MEQPREVTPDTIEQARELIRQVREHLTAGSLDPALDIFRDLHPADQAELLGELSQEQQRGLLSALDVETSARILEQMEPADAAKVFGEVEAPALSDILDEAPPDVAADLLKQLPEEQSQQTLEEMAERQDVVPLLGYGDETAGGIMTTDYISVRDDTTAALALDRVRIGGPEMENVGSIPVVSQEGRLVGFLGLVRLALARPAAVVGEIMEPEVRSVPSETDQEECARIVKRYDLQYLPVVDQEQRLIGLILLEDLVDVLEEEATEDMYRIAGLGDERVFGPLQSSVGRRLPWLYLNLATAIVAALVISLFESTIVKVVALAVFLPVIAGQGGIGGTQTLTLVIRSIAIGDLPQRRALRLLAREALLGVVHGVLLGVAIGVIGYLWKGTPMLGVILGVAMLGNMAVAGLAGAATPMVLRRIGIDPALGSAVILTTITDVVGFLLFLGMAAALVNYLV